MATETPPQKPTQRPAMPVHHTAPRPPDPPQPPDDERAEPALNDGEILPDDQEPMENQQSPQMPNIYRAKP